MSSSLADRARSRGEAGFTLLEMMIVLVVVGLALGMVLARGPEASPALALHAATRRVSAGLRLARSQAIARDRPVAVSFTAVPPGFRIGRGPATRLPEGVTLDAAGRGQPAAIVFQPDGSTAGGTVLLAAGRLVRSVTVDWLSGRVATADAAEAR